MTLDGCSLKIAEWKYLEIMFTKCDNEYRFAFVTIYIWNRIEQSSDCVYDSYAYIGVFYAKYSGQNYPGVQV